MIFFQLSKQLQLLAKLLQGISDTDYTRKISHLGNASIGGHTRHIIELLQCAINGYHTGEADYVNRSRDMRLEGNRTFALSALQKIEAMAELPDKRLRLTIEHEAKDNGNIPVMTTYFREIVYNSEHTLHHLALIKVALIELNVNVVDQSFGVAYSTIKYRAQTGQLQ
ncbi:MAG: hypothetical protein ABIQ31_06545 [Ferruginibacter sp.]